MSACDIPVTGRISAIETLGLVDGPGVRSVVFLKGCLLRCQYCHNPETWGSKKETLYSPEALAAFLLRYRGYQKNGGVTFSGGEPLLQAEFLAQTAALLKENGVHICLDTAGVCPDDTDFSEGSAVARLLDLTDLVLLDVKAVAPEDYLALTGRNIAPFFRFLALVQQKQTPLWLRRVIVPGKNDTPDAIAETHAFAATLSHVEKVEFLPYHTLGVEKYAKLGIPYPLAGVPSLSDERLAELIAAANA